MLAHVEIADCPEWAWQETAAEVVADTEDADFYATYGAELAEAGARLLSDRLRMAWRERGVSVVFVLPAAFEQRVCSANEQVYFAVWDRAAWGLSFSDVVEAAGLHAEYVESANI